MFLDRKPNINGIPQADFEVTIPSGKVGSDLSEFPLMIDLSDMPSTFWDIATQDGWNIAAYADDMTVRYPVDVVYCNPSNQTGVVFVKTDIAAASDTDIRLMVRSGRVIETDDSTYGRNQVWSDYDVVLALGCDPRNRTGKGKSVTHSYPQMFNKVQEWTGIEGHEGVVSDGSTFVTIGDNDLFKYNSDFSTQLLHNDDPAGDTGTAATGCGGGCYFDGKIYVTTGAPQQISVFDYSDLSFIGTFDISATGASIGGLSIHPLDPDHIYGIPYVSGAGSDDLIKYNRHTGAHVETITMSSNIPLAQGIIAWRDGFLVPSDTYDRYMFVGLNGDVNLYGLFGEDSATVEDGFAQDGSVYVFEADFSNIGKVQKWTPYDLGLSAGGGVYFGSDARILCPLDNPTNTWAMGLSFSRADNTGRVPVFIGEETGFTDAFDVYYSGSQIRAAYDAANGSMNFSPSVNPSIWEMGRINVVYDGTTERRAYWNGGNKTVDSGITARGSTYFGVALGSNGYDSDSFSWRGYMGLLYVRQDALSDDWIAAEYDNLDDPSTFYSVVEA